MTNDNNSDASKKVSLLAPNGEKSDEVIIYGEEPLTTDSHKGYHQIPEEFREAPEYRTGSFHRTIQNPDTNSTLGDQKVHLELPMYVDFITYYNFPRETAAHALMTYAFQLGYILESPDLANASIASGTDLIAQSARNMLQTQCSLYNVEPEEAIRYWPDVDRILDTLNLSPIPHNPKYRFVRLSEAKLTAATTALINSIESISGNKTPS